MAQRPRVPKAGAMAFVPPQQGDRVLVLRRPWLLEVLSGVKVLEVRGRRLAPGRYYLGCAGSLWGHIDVGAATLCQSAQHWRALAAQHRVLTPAPPYRKTWLHRLSCLRAAPAALPYTHPCGAIGVVVYRQEANAE